MEENTEQLSIDNTRAYFPFYASYFIAINDCFKDEPQHRLIFIEAIIKYSLFDEEPAFDNKLLKLAFDGMRPNMDASKRKYENGKRGGCPKGTTKPSMKGNQNAAKRDKAPKQNQIKTYKGKQDNGDGQRNKAYRKKPNEYGQLQDLVNIESEALCEDSASSQIYKILESPPKLDI